MLSIIGLLGLPKEREFLILKSTWKPLKTNRKNSKTKIDGNSLEINAFFSNQIGLSLNFLKNSRDMVEILQISAKNIINII